MAKATTKAAKIEPLKSWDDGLDAAAVKAVGDCIKNISLTAAKTYKETAAALATCKAALPERNWVKWTNEAQLNIGARTMQDLAGANAWLQSTTVPDEMLGKIAARAMAMIAACTDAAKVAELEKRLIGGEVLTVSQVKVSIEGAPEEKAKPATKKELEAKIAELEQLLAMRKEFTDEQVGAADKFKAERDAALGKVEQLEQFIKAMSNAINTQAIPETNRGALTTLLADKATEITINSRSARAAAV